MDEENIYSIVIGLICVSCIIIVILLFAYRFELFIDRSLYGIYSEPVSTSCINKTGKCSDMGLITTINYCLPNKTTGNGCLVETENGLIQTFNSIEVTDACKSQCRSSVWEITGISECMNINGEIDGCLSDPIDGRKEITRKCVKNDTSGINTCTYNVGTLDIPCGCYLDKNNTTVICEIGAEYKEFQSCSDPIYPKCGEWIKYSFTDHIIPSSECINNKTFDKYQGILDFYKYGFTLNEILCVNGVKCKRLPDNLENMECNNNNGLVTTTYIDDVPYYLSPCIYYDKEVIINTRWSDQIKNLIGDFSVLTKNNFFLSLNNAPCPISLNEEDYINPKKYLDNIDLMPKLSDCMGKTTVPLKPTLCLMIRSNIRNNCLNDFLESSLLISLKPIREGFGNVIHCRIIGLFGGNYLGILTYNNGYLWWNQKNYNKEPTNIEDLIHSEFIVYYENGLYNIRDSYMNVINVETTDNTFTTLDNIMFNNNLGEMQDLLKIRELNRSCVFQNP